MCEIGIIYFVLSCCMIKRIYVCLNVNINIYNIHVCTSWKNRTLNNSNGHILRWWRNAAHTRRQKTPIEIWRQDCSQSFSRKSDRFSHMSRPPPQIRSQISHRSSHRSLCTSQISHRFWSQISHRFCTDFSQISYRFLTDFLQVSHRFLTGFSQISSYPWPKEICEKSVI